MQANSMINSAIMDSTIQDLGIVVIDEMHMLDDHHRGYIIEILAAKLLSLELPLQLVGMSATLSNVEMMAKWLNAKYYVSKYKPIPIKEHLVCDNVVYRLNDAPVEHPQGSGITNMHESRQIQASGEPALKNILTNAVVALTMETVLAGHGVLVFCSSRAACETTALLIAQTMPSLKTVDSEMLSRRQDMIDSLRSLVLVPLDGTLAETIRYGVGFHHAGLASEEREILAAAFDNGTLRVITATCSLAAGINLPARRVILQGARMGRDLVAPAMLRQMRGRAGRKGKDEVGETYVCCKATEIEEVRDMLSAELQPINSSLRSERRGIKRAVLECIVVGLARHEHAIEDFVERTLLAQLVDKATLKSMIAEVIQELRSSKLITATDDGQHETTDLGRATVLSGMSPENSTFAYTELQRAMQSFVLDGELHVFYMFTPISELSEDPDSAIDWPTYRSEIASLDESSLRVMTLVGVNPGFINAQANARSSMSLTTPSDQAKARIHRRFYIALQLRDLCNEVTLSQVARKYKVARGTVQALWQSCQGFAAATIRFCKEMHWDLLAAVLEHMSDRLIAGARADLLELARVPFVKSRTARVLWENGYRGVRSVAEAEVDGLVSVLMLVQPRRRRRRGGWDGGERSGERERQDDSDSEESEAGYRRKLRGVAEIIRSAASRLWERQQQMELQQQMVDIEASM